MLSVKDFSLQFVKNICEKATYYENKPKDMSNLDYQNKILMNIFFEPSTRTMLSFQTAMYKFGGKVINFNKEISSINKGESFKDTIMTLKNFADVFVIRHPEIGKVQEAEKILNKPVINAGDGAGEHPTQALLDFYTIFKHFDVFNEDTKLNILFIGDIENSRTIHSLDILLKKLSHINIHYKPYDKNSLSVEKKKELGLNVKYYPNLEEYDVIYYTRIQKERSINTTASYDKNDILNLEKMKLIKKNAIIMHPLPRNNEISPDVDSDPRCVYFEQIENGIYVRMAILNNLFSNKIPIDKSTALLFAEINKWEL